MKELDKTMYFKASPAIFENARRLRGNMTDYEKLLWEKLKGKQICGIRFRRQHPIDIFIADFYCHDVRLVVEIDGEIHNQQEEYDIGRTSEMERYNIKVIRFKNFEIETDIKKVVLEIENIVSQLLTSPPWGI
jgi:very-short-patch-repair endonuclease